MKEEGQELFDRMYALVMDKIQHDFWVHGAGFCQTCGELKKRCECKEFNADFVCNCFEK